MNLTEEQVDKLLNLIFDYGISRSDYGYFSDGSDGQKHAMEFSDETMTKICELLGKRWNARMCRVEDK